MTTQKKRKPRTIEGRVAALVGQLHTDHGVPLLVAERVIFEAQQIGIEKAIKPAVVTAVVTRKNFEVPPL